MAQLFDQVTALVNRELGDDDAARRPLVRLKLIADQAADAAGRLVDAAREQMPPSSPVACAAGCAWCCHLPVGATVAELAAVVDAVRSWPAAEQAALRARVKKLAAERRASSPAEWGRARQPCPLLDEEKRCRVYQARPLSCRGLNSLSAARCESFFFAGRGAMRAWAPQFDLHREARVALSAALSAALDEERHLLELVAALDVALSLPTDGWLDGSAWAAARFDEALPAYRGGSGS